ncbi:MAG TPA: hypothetical protein VMZ28_09720 [Kofleriaceae bacterium]|nr:hypothetical protein [Kofleriaceae bacterium]
MKHRMLYAAIVAALAQAACNSPGDVADGNQDAGTAEELDEWDQRLGEREVDYNAALRVAALRLTGELPTLAEIKSVADAGDLPAQRTVYRALVKAYIDGPAFTIQMIRFWRDVLKVGGSGAMDTPAVFAAQVTVEGRPYTELFTATAGTCPTYDREAMTFTATDCASGAPAHAGLLSHPAVMGQFFSNMAFRRVRWVQEVFDCTAFPVEIGEPQDVGGAADYNGVWPFGSVASLETGGNVDFQDARSVVCANCHQTMNHLAPLFANFDADGQWQDAIAVPLPLDGAPPAKLEDWLVAGEETAWRYGVPAADLPALGQVMASDPRVAECAVARVWNWALGKQDIVDALAVVPSSVVADQVADFVAGGHVLKNTIYAVFTSDDFVRF